MDIFIERKCSICDRVFGCRSLSNMNQVYVCKECPFMEGLKVCKEIRSTTYGLCSEDCRDKFYRDLMSSTHKGD